jgi:hypothetical protein
MPGELPGIREKISRSMTPEQFLSPEDASRAQSTLRRLARHDISRWALTGGFAIEIKLRRRGVEPYVRALNDIDFIADSFDSIPDSLAEDFLFRHVHPLDPPGKTMLQCVDPDAAVRIDVFRANGATMSRTSRLDFQGGTIRLISLEDLLARTARLALDLAEGVSVPAKHARDFLRLIKLMNPPEVEKAWQDHRRSQHPVSFAETSRQLQDLIPASQNLLTTPDYSKDATELCGRCAPTAAFRLADPKVLLCLLGYC